MPKNITQFDLLISCPSDVKEELHIINETVAEFNRMFGAANNTSLVTKHWSTDSYPQSGGKPQDLLNKQFALDCDAAVAVFWTRFGTPTDNYGSGTEEEIEELINSGKQVFLYFSDRQVNPASLDLEQYKKVMDFRERYKNKGIYAPYSDLIEFKKNFLNHLSLYFVNLLTNGNESKSNNNSSKLSVKGVRKGKVSENPIIYKKFYQNSIFMKDFQSNILNLFKQVKNIHIPNHIEKVKEKTLESHEKVPKDVNESPSKLGDIGMELQGQFKGINSIFGSVEIALQDELQSEIKIYAEEFEIEISINDFFNIGELTKQKQPFGGGPIGTGLSYSLVGSDEEKEKYRLLNQLYEKISEYRQWKSYFEALDSLFYIDLSLTNFGTSYDEDVDIKLYVETGYLCTGKQLPFPGNDILETAIKFIDPFFKPKKSLTVIEYSDYPDYVPLSPPVSDISLYGFSRSYDEEVESNKEEFIESIDDVFCYDYFQDDSYDVICYKQSYIKQNTNVYFPSIIAFHDIPSTIHFEISSKFFPEVIKGELKPELEK